LCWKTIIKEKRRSTIKTDRKERVIERESEFSLKQKGEKKNNKTQIFEVDKVRKSHPCGLGGGYVN